MEINIGANIKRLRTAKNVTQEQLSVQINVTCAAVSKWERGETYPDITLLQPLAYYFGVSLDELMGYDQQKTQAEIEKAVALYRQCRHSNYNKASEIITKAYRKYPNDYWIMHYYMWNIGGGLADNEPAVLLAHKDEFLAICDKILEGCTEENIRLNAWNMRAKLLHAEGRTEEALDIYTSKFSDWYCTCGQKCEQLFDKDTEAYYYHLEKNMYELANFAADKLGRSLFFNPSLSMKEKAERAMHYGKLLLEAFEETNELFFLVLAKALLGRMENDLIFRGGTDEQVIAAMDKNLYVAKKLTEQAKSNKALRAALYKGESLFEWELQYRLEAQDGRRAELLKNTAYVEVMNKYK